MSVDLKSLSREMDRGIFSYCDAVILMAEYERLGLEGCENAIDRIDHGYDRVDDLRAIHNAIELAYAKERDSQTPLAEVCPPQSTLRQQLQELFGGRTS